MDIDEQIKALKEAKRRRQRALAMFQAGKTQKQIAAELGVTRQRVMQLVAKASQDGDGK